MLAIVSLFSPFQRFGVLPLSVFGVVSSAFYWFGVHMGRRSQCCFAVGVLFLVFGCVGRRDCWVVRWVGCGGRRNLMVVVTRSS